MDKKEKVMTCYMCGKEFIGINNRKFCDACKKERRKLYDKKYHNNLYCEYRSPINEAELNKQKKSSVDKIPFDEHYAENQIKQTLELIRRNK